MNCLCISIAFHLVKHVQTDKNDMQNCIDIIDIFDITLQLVYLGENYTIAQWSSAESLSEGTGKSQPAIDWMGSVWIGGHWMSVLTIAEISLLG